MRNCFIAIIASVFLSGCGEKESEGVDEEKLAKALLDELAKRGREAEKQMEAAVKVAQAKEDMNTLMTALEIYKRNGGSYPTNDQGLEALYEEPTSAPRPRRWVKLVKIEEGPFDPWDTKYKYQFPGSKDPNIPEIISAGPDRKFGTEDDQSTQDE